MQSARRGAVSRHLWDYDICVYARRESLPHTALSQQSLGSVPGPSVSRGKHVVRPRTRHISLRDSCSPPVTTILRCTIRTTRMCMCMYPISGPPPLAPHPRPEIKSVGPARVVEGTLSYAPCTQTSRLAGAASIVPPPRHLRRTPTCPCRQNHPRRRQCCTTSPVRLVARTRGACRPPRP